MFFEVYAKGTLVCQRLTKTDPKRARPRTKELFWPFPPRRLFGFASKSRDHCSLMKTRKHCTLKVVILDLRISCSVLYHLLTLMFFVTVARLFLREVWKLVRHSKTKLLFFFSPVTYRAKNHYLKEWCKVREGTSSKLDVVVHVLTAYSMGFFVLDHSSCAKCTPGYFAENYLTYIL